MQISQINIFCRDEQALSHIIQHLPPDTSTTILKETSDFERALKENSQIPVVLLAADAEDITRILIANQQLIKPPFLVVAQSNIPVTAVRALMTLRPQIILSFPLDTTVFQSALTAVDNVPQAMEKDPAAVSAHLNQRLQELNTIYTVGKSVAASLDINEVLERVVLASVNLTQADAGYIILREQEQLIVHIAKYEDERFPLRLHETVADSIAWQVIRSNRPVMLNRETTIAGNFVAQSLLYVPITAPGQGTIGVLGVANRLRNNEDPDAAGFSEQHLFTLSSVADYAAIAVENARLFSLVETERSRLSAVLENAAEIIVVTDEFNHLWLWSKSAANIWMFTPQSVGKPISDYVSDSQLLDLFAKVNDTGDILQTEIEMEDGKIYNSQLSPIDQVGRLVVMHDISHLKDLDRLKSEFVSTVSHDLRTPLTTIQGYIDLLNKAGPLNDLQTGFIQKAQLSLQYITELISDLLDIGRVETGYDLEMEPVSMLALIQQTVENEVIQAKNEGIEIYSDLTGDPLWVWGNTRRLQQVLQNLLSNAVKYNRPGGWVRANGQRDGDYIIISIKDNGLGISLEEQYRIFDRFYRVQTPETEDIIGTGLGLAIVKTVIEKHDGRIWVESSQGNGSNFTFVLKKYDKEPEN